MAVIAGKADAFGEMGEPCEDCPSVDVSKGTKNIRFYNPEKEEFLKVEKWVSMANISCGSSQVHFRFTPNTTFDHARCYSEARLHIINMKGKALTAWSGLFRYISSFCVLTAGIV